VLPPRRSRAPVGALRSTDPAARESTSFTFGSAKYRHRRKKYSPTWTPAAVVSGVTRNTAAAEPPSHMLCCVVSSSTVGGVRSIVTGPLRNGSQPWWDQVPGIRVGRHLELGRSLGHSECAQVGVTCSDRSAIRLPMNPTDAAPQ